MTIESLTANLTRSRAKLAAATTATDRARHEAHIVEAEAAIAKLQAAQSAPAQSAPAQSKK